MKTLLISACLAVLPAVALAQSAPEKAAPKKTSAKTTKAKDTKDTKAKEPKATTTAKATKAKPSASRVEIKSTANQVASGLRAADAALAPEQLAIAQRVYVGDMACELGAHVKVSADAKTPGYFQLEGKGFSYRMAPVPTSTGAVRLEDQDGGGVWLQIANKSMLMDQKRGQRLADECKGPEQVAVAEALKKAPQRSLLDAPASK